MTDTATIDTTEDAVRAAAFRADAGEPADTPAVDTPETDAQTSPENNGQPAEKGSDAQTQKPEKATSKPAPPAPTAEKPATEKTPPAKPETAYTKAQKEQARLDTSWKKLQAEKEEHRQERARFEQQRAEFQKQRTAPEPKAVKPEENPDILEALAKQYEAEDNDEMAQLARSKAAHFRELAKQQQPPQAAATRAPADPTTDPEFVTAWNKNRDELLQEYPYLNDPANPIRLATEALRKNEAYGHVFNSQRNGLKLAHQVALLQTDAAQLKPLQEELAKVKAEAERLTKLTSIRGAPPPSGSGRGHKSLADLSGDDAEDFVRNAAMKADRGDTT